MKPFLASLLLCAVAVPVVARQAATLQPSTVPQPVLHTHPVGEPHFYCATDPTSPEARAALADYIEARDAGLLPRARKSASLPDIGDTAMFNIQAGNDLNESPWTEHEFTLVDKADNRYYLWVETGELDNSNVTDGEVASLRSALLEQTPAPSYNPNAGIVANNELIFGPPPNYDGDGFTDILLFDIEPSNESTFQTLGYVHTVDISPSAPQGVGNQADVLYLDSKQGTNNLDDLAWIAAHEYTHLIHFGHLRDMNGNVQLLASEALLFEAFAEYAMVLNGYFVRSTSYLQNPDETNFDLFGWRSMEQDYQRGGLFATYIADQIGFEAAGTMVSEGVINANGLRQVLQDNGTTLDDIVTNFHLANLLNDADFDTRYGYSIAGRQNARATVTATVDGNKVGQTHETIRAAGSGGAEYLVWENVADFELSLDVNEDNPQLVDILRARLRIPVVLQYEGGNREVRMVAPQGAATLFTGVFEKVTVVVAHMKPDQVATPYKYSAQWTPSAPGFIFEQVAYDDGNIIAETDDQGQVTAVEAYNNLGASARIANRFEVPENATLYAVAVTPYYEHDFSGSEVPDNAPRDYRLSVWADDGTGVPGDELFGLDVTDDRTSITLPAFAFHTVDLSAYEAELASLPDAVFIGISNAGVDPNYFVMGLSAYSGPNVSFVYVSIDNSLKWWRFADIGSDEASFADRTLPIRATFKISIGPVANEDEATLPAHATLAQNYPNPFNPTTTIQYSLPQAMPVRLVVHDVLGREVATLVDGLQTAGTHEVAFEAGRQANGLYFYTLETVDRSQTRTMVLLK